MPFVSREFYNTSARGKLVVKTLLCQPLGYATPVVNNLWRWFRQIYFSWLIKLWSLFCVYRMALVMKFWRIRYDEKPELRQAAADIQIESQTFLASQPGGEYSNFHLLFLPTLSRASIMLLRFFPHLATLASARATVCAERHHHWSFALRIKFAYEIRQWLEFASHFTLDQTIWRCLASLQHSNWVYSWLTTLINSSRSFALFNFVDVAQNAHIRPASSFARLWTGAKQNFQANI